MPADQRASTVAVRRWENGGVKRSGIADLPLHGGRVPEWAFLGNHSADGDWAIVQQGMNAASRLARRYPWHSAAVRDFTLDPHTAIVGQPVGAIRNLVDRRAKPAQEALLAIAAADPADIIAEVRRLEMPTRHDVRSTDVNAKRLGAVLALAHERDLRDFASFLLLEQLGPRTLQSLALVAEVVHGTPTRFDDPARFSFGTAARMAIRSRCPCASTTNPSRCCGVRWMPPSSDGPTSSQVWRGSMSSPAR
jgi:hypothetical protein